MVNESLVHIMEKFEKSFQLQNEIISQSLEQNKTSAKEYYISSAKTFDGKYPKEFNDWLENVNRLPRISGKDLLEVALATSTGHLHKYISELMGLGFDWKVTKSKTQKRLLANSIYCNIITYDPCHLVGMKYWKFMSEMLKLLSKIEYKNLDICPIT